MMIIALAGRRIDAPDSKAVRFPLKNVGKVKKNLRKLFMSLKPLVLVCSGACGADLIALEVAGSLGIHRSMVLPFDQNTFKATSVIDRPGDWGVLFDKICMEVQHEEEIVVMNYSDADDTAYEKTNFDVLERAQLLADKDAISQKVALIVWEGKAKDKNDTTEHFKQLAEEMNFKIVEINTIKFH